MSSFCKCKSYSHFFSKTITVYAKFHDQNFNDTLTMISLVLNNWAVFGFLHTKTVFSNRIEFASKRSIFSFLEEISSLAFLYISTLLERYVLWKGIPFFRRVQKHSCHGCLKQFCHLRGADSFLNSFLTSQKGIVCFLLNISLEFECTFTSNEVIIKTITDTNRV